MKNKNQEALDQIIPDYIAMTNVANDNLCEQFQKMYYEHRQVLQELVDKSIPKKVININNTEFEMYKCPNCHVKFISDGIEKYCDECGQAFDWSNDED